MDFQAKLAKLRDRIEGRLPQEYLNIMHRATHDLEQSGIQEQVLKVGDHAPEFVLKNQDGQLISSRTLCRKGF